jgi:glycosyltransferase involved in cell wall biosynthesis
MTSVIMAVHSDYVHDRRVRNQATALVEAGYHVKVLCVGDTATNSTKGVTATSLDGVQLLVHHLRHKSGKRRFREMMAAYAVTLKGMSADVIHAHDLDTLIPCSKAASRMGARLIYDSHELYTESIHVAHRPLIKLIWRIIELSHISKADTVITVCKGIAEELKERYRLESIPNVVRNFSDPLSDASRVETPSQLTDFKRYHPKCMLYQGYIQRGRGLDAALEALVGMPDWGLVICGQGPYEKALREKAAALHVDEQVLWMGQLDHDTLYSVTRSCDLGLCLIEPVTLSYYYALPNKLIEYVQAGLPVIGSNLPEISRIMNEYFIGWIVNDDDLQTVMKSFDSLKNDKKLEAGMRFAADSLNWQHEKLALLSVYSKVVK